jgi:hypothetical protein
MIAGTALAMWARMQLGTVMIVLGSLMLTLVGCVRTEAPRAPRVRTRLFEGPPGVTWDMKLSIARADTAPPRATRYPPPHAFRYRPRY